MKEFRRHFGAIVFLSVIGHCGDADAQNEARETGCSEAETQTEMNLCAFADWQEADAELNGVYQKALEIARFADDFEPEDMKGAEAALRDAQRAWIMVRDSHCTVAGFQARGGSMEPLIVNECKTRLTRTRTEQLQRLVQDLGTQ